MMRLVALGGLAAGCHGKVLTSQTWEGETAGKQVFIKFQAPWWGHCKSMKPAWDQLANEFKDSKFSGVYDVDCTADDSKDLCTKAGVSGYPTIKYGSGEDMEKLEPYEGGRDFDSLKKFAEENLAPVCGPKALDACSDTEKKQIESSSAKPFAELDKAVKKLAKDFGDREKKHNKKRSKFDEKDKEVQDEWQDHLSDKRNSQKAKDKLEKNEKATKSEKSKQAEKDKKLDARGTKLEKQRDALDKERNDYHDKKEALDAEITESGLKLMKVVRDSRKKEEL